MPVPAASSGSGRPPVVASEKESPNPESGPTDIELAVQGVEFGLVRPDGSILLKRERWEVIALEGNGLVERSWSVDPFARTAFNDGLGAALNIGRQEIAVVDLVTGERRAHDGLHRPDGTEFFAAAVYPETDGILAIDPAGTIARFEGASLVESLDFPARLDTGTRFEDRLAVIEGVVEGERVAHLVDLTAGAARVLFSVPAPSGFSVHPSIGGGMHVFDTDGTLRTYDRDGTLVGQMATGADSALVNTMDATSGLLAVLPGDGGVTLIDTASGTVEHILDDDPVANIGLAENGRLLVVVGFDGTIRIWDVERGSPAGFVWDGSGVGLGSPPWFDESNGVMWVFSSGRFLAIPLDAERWIERACSLVSRDLTVEEWERLVPGDQPPRPACA